MLIFQGRVNTFGSAMGTLVARVEIGTGRRVTLDDMERVAVEILLRNGPVRPYVEVDDVDHECVAFPVTARQRPSAGRPGEPRGAARSCGMLTEIVWMYWVQEL